MYSINILQAPTGNSSGEHEFVYIFESNKQLANTLFLNVLIDGKNKLGFLLPTYIAMI